MSCVDALTFRHTTKCCVPTMPVMTELVEAAAFTSTLASVEADQLTACSDWRAHELIAHVAAGAAAIAENVGGFNKGGVEAVPPTVALAEREAPYHRMSFSELRSRLATNHDHMMSAIDIALSEDPAAATPWAGRQMPIAAFVTHARSEYALHRWDLVGDDDIGTELLAQPDLTDHAVHALGEVLTTRGVAAGADGDVRLSSPGRRDISVGPGGAVYAESDNLDITIEGDPAARLLLLWGRSPTQPGRLRVPGGVAQLSTLRRLLSGY